MEATSSIFGRIIVIGMVVYGNSLTTRGHDLLHDNRFPHQATIDCFSVNSHQADSASRVSVDPVVAVTKPTHSFSLIFADHILLSELPLSSASANLFNAWQFIRSEAKVAADAILQSLDHAQLQCMSSPEVAAYDLAIARPDIGLPPRPKSKAQAAHADALAQFLQQFEDFQCQASQAFHDRASLQRAIAEKTHNLIRTANALASKLITPLETATADSQLSTGLQYVIFETSTGGHIVLTVSQAQQWQFAVPVAKNSVAMFLTTAAQSKQQHAVETICGQLKWAGESLIGLSQAISNLTPAKVADRINNYR